MNISSSGDAVIVTELSEFNIERVFDCGQCFRFDPAGDGAIAGVAMGRYIRLTQPEPGTLIARGTSEREFRRVWVRYLALDADYAGIAASFAGDPVLERAAKCASGIRILRQEPWETLCSFIISQNNNIPRIKGLIDKLCRAYGDPVDTDYGRFYAFPNAARLAEVSVDDLFALKTGFRAKYIADAARKVASGEVDLDAVASLPTPEAARELCRINGVGPKVAACTLLFGFGRGDSFPVDVWVRRVLAKYYPGGFDPASLGDRAGIAQQYLFYYERYHGGDGNA